MNTENVLMFKGTLKMPSNFGVHFKEIVRWASKEKDVHIMTLFMPLSFNSLWTGFLAGPAVTRQGVMALN